MENLEGEKEREGEKEGENMYACEIGELERMEHRRGNMCGKGRQVVYSVRVRLQ